MLEAAQLDFQQQQKSRRKNVAQNWGEFSITSQESLSKQL